MEGVAHFLALFVAGVILDALWALLVRATAQGHRIAAANLSALLVGGSTLSLGDILASGWWSFAGYVLGAWVGTYLVLRYSNAK